MAFETSRRRFLLGIGASGALLATPLPVIEFVEAVAAQTPPSPASGIPGSAVLRFVDALSWSNRPIAGALEITKEQFLAISATSETPAIEIDSLYSDCKEFIPGPTTNELVLEGVIDKSLQDALMDGKVFPLSVKIPGLDQWISSRAFVREIAFRDPWTD